MRHWVFQKALKMGHLRATQVSSVSKVNRIRFMSTASLPRIGFIGLGNMGFPMAKNLASSSLTDETSLLVFDAKPQAISQAADLNVVDSLTDRLADQEVIITMLPGDEAVNAVMSILHKHWADTASSDKRRMVIDCSTVSPTTSQVWSKTLQETQTAVLFDAPVSGGVKGATDGTLTFMLGGCSALENSNDDTSATRHVKPILEQMGARVIDCGPNVGAGAATKLCNNLALAAQMIGICEALNLGESLDVDPQVLASVLNSSTASCWSSKVNNPHPKVAASTGAPASKDYQGGFATNLMLKDLGLAMKVASEKHVALPLTSTSKELYQMASLQGKGSQDFGVMLQVLRGKEDR